MFRVAEEMIMAYVDGGKWSDQSRMNVLSASTEFDGFCQGSSTFHLLKHLLQQAFQESYWD